MVTGTIHVDLSAIPASSHKGRVYAALTEAPNGARVVLMVGALTLVTPEALPWLRQHVDRLDFDVHGEPAAVRRWVESLRSGEVEGVSG